MQAVNALKWTGEYNMECFVNEFSRSLPVLIKTITGILGCDELHAISRDEMYFIYDILKQKRIIAAMKNHTAYLSIPVNYPVKFELYTDPDSSLFKAKSLSDIIQDLELQSNKKFYIRALHNEKLSFQFGPDTGNSAKFGMLEVIDTYDEKYVLGHPICGDAIHSNTYGIPVYMNIEMTVASGFETHPLICFTSWFDMLKDTAKQLPKSEITTCQEIIIFDKRPSSGTYEYLNPKFVNFGYASLVLEDLTTEVITHTDNPQPSKQILSRNKRGQSIKLPGIPRRAPPPLPEAHNKVKKSSSFSNISDEPNDYFNKMHEKLKKIHKPKVAAGRPKTSMVSANPCVKHPLTSSLSMSVVRSNSPSANTATRFHNGFMTSDSKAPALLKEDSGDVKNIVDIKDACYTKLESYQSNSNALHEIAPDADFSKFSIKDVQRCLRILKMEHHCENFEKNQIDGELLLCLNIEIMTSEFKMLRFEALKLFKFLEGWRPSQ